MRFLLFCLFFCGVLTQFATAQVAAAQVAAAQVVTSDYYRQKAEAYYEQANYDQARRYYLKAYDLVRRSDPARAANLCVDISSLDHLNGQFRQATNRCWVGVAHLRNAKQMPDSLWFKLHSSLGTMYKNLHLRDSALYHYGQADAVLARSPAVEGQIPDYVSSHYGNQGIWYQKMGNYNRYIAYLNQARAVALRHSRTNELPYIDADLAFSYDFLGKKKEALEAIKHANENYPKKDFYKANYLMGLGWLYQKNGRFTNALFQYNQALKILEDNTDNSRIASEKAELYRLLSEVHRKQGNFEKSKKYLELGLAIIPKQNGLKGTRVAQLYTEEARWYADQKKYLLASESYQKATNALIDGKPVAANSAINTDKVINGNVLLSILVEKAAILTQQYRLSKDSTVLLTAAQTYCAAAQLKTNLHLSYEAEETKLLFTEEQQDLFPEAIAVVYEAYALRRSLQWQEALFRLFEQSAAGSLHDALRLRELHLHNLPDTLVAQEQSLQREITQLRLAPQSSKNEAKRTRNRFLWHQLVATFERDYPAYYQLKYQPLALTSKAFRQHLDPRTAYVAYRQAGNFLYVLVVTNNEAEILRQPIDATLWQQAKEQLRRSLYQNPGFGNYDGVASATLAYRYLIEPLKPWLVGRSRLIVQRDWDLQWLPFEVLESGKKIHDYVVRKYALSYAYSAQMWVSQNLVPAVSPVLPTLVVAPFARFGAENQVALAHLATSEAEARRIGGELWLGTAATKARFMVADLRRNIIHLATHAQTDDTDPAQSFVAFYPEGDYRLRTEEIYQLPLQHTRLVVLSACETGDGRAARGEGVLSLARAFVYAGCPSVLTTLWGAQDKCTSFLSLRLHQHLQNGLPIDEALQQAREDFFASPLFLKFNHPHYWANLVLLGNAKSLVFGKQWHQNKAIAAALTFSMLLLIGMVYKNRRLQKTKKAGIA